MSAAHTPGPWIVVGKFSDEVRAVAGRHAKTIAYMSNGSRDSLLVAAAPAMLAALQEILAINNEDQGTFRKRGGTRRGLSIVAAREAIEIATGSAK